MHDLVIRGGMIVDGTGTQAYSGDLAIDGNIIAQVGGKVGLGKREIDAAGALVQPGWVDVHTHYDGQVTWDPLIGPSCWHGVTTIVMGNCGVGFAPVRPNMHNDLIELMEGVEDIPGAALHEGVDWRWESFPEFMDALGAMNHAIDIGVQVPHSPLRAYVMGAAASGERPATEDEMVQMANLLEEGLASGALGFTTSKTKFHRTSKNEHVPSYTADLQELRTIVGAMKKRGEGLIGVLSDFDEPDEDMAGLRQLSASSGRPLYYLLVQFDDKPDKWRRLLELSRPNGDGAMIRPQVCPRPVGFFLGLECSLHPFMSKAAYKEIRDLSLADRVERMRDPEFKQRVISEVRQHKSHIMQEVTGAFDKMFRLGDPPNYEPSEDQSIAAMAMREGRVAGIDARIFRVSFTGELGYEVSVANCYSLALWQAFLRVGENYDLTPIGIEALHVLRAEKGYIAVGHDTDGTTTPGDLGMDWIVSTKKDFIGRRSLARADSIRADRKHLVGLLLEARVPEGAQIVAEHSRRPPMKMIGHVSSCYDSAALDRPIALALIVGGRERMGETVTIPLTMEGRVVKAEIVRPVFDAPEGTRLNV